MESEKKVPTQKDWLHAAEKLDIEFVYRNYSEIAFELHMFYVCICYRYF